MKLEIVCMASLLFATPAFAGWQYTDWGMTPQEVVTASNGLAIVPEKLDTYVDSVVMLKAIYISGMFEFDAGFAFEDARSLNMVVLDLKNKNDCPSLLISLKNAYGPPQSADHNMMGPMSEWWDKKNGNNVRLLDQREGGFGCRLQYRRIVNPGEQGGL